MLRVMCKKRQGKGFGDLADVFAREALEMAGTCEYWYVVVFSFPVLADEFMLQRKDSGH
jgi:hypothetical protein